jgi:hypothetical protein
MPHLSTPSQTWIRTRRGERMSSGRPARQAARAMTHTEAEVSATRVSTAEEALIAQAPQRFLPGLAGCRLTSSGVHAWLVPTPDHYGRFIGCRSTVRIFSGAARLGSLG